MARSPRLTDSDFSTTARVLAAAWRAAAGQRPPVLQWTVDAWDTLDRLRCRAQGVHPNVIYWLVQAQRAAYAFELALKEGYAQSAGLRLQDWLVRVLYALTQARLEARRKR